MRRGTACSLNQWRLRALTRRESSQQGDRDPGRFQHRRVSVGEGRRLERGERVRGRERERERNRREGGISTALLCDWKFNREREREGEEEGAGC